MIFLERTRKSQRQSDKHWNCSKGNVMGLSETGGAHNYGLFRAHKYHLELNWAGFKHRLLENSFVASNIDCWRTVLWLQLLEDSFMTSNTDCWLTALWLLQRLRDWQIRRMNLIVQCFPNWFLVPGNTILLSTFCRRRKEETDRQKEEEEEILFQKNSAE